MTLRWQKQIKYFLMEIKDPPRIIANAMPAYGDAGMFSHKNT